mgnify:FL=1
MTNNKSNETSNNESIITLNFRGYDKNMETAAKSKNKLQLVKAKIEASINSNLTYEKDNSALPASMKMLKDVGDYTVITLRCGAYKIFQNTVLKSEYNHIQILDGLKSMLNGGQFDEQIAAYANKKTKKVSAKKDAKKKEKSTVAK